MTISFEYDSAYLLIYILFRLKQNEKVMLWLTCKWCIFYSNIANFENTVLLFVSFTGAVSPLLF